MKNAISMTTQMIAPCGMNCALCIAYQRVKNKCDGCLNTSPNKPSHCNTCKIKFCVERQHDPKLACYNCHKFPCTRLKQMDKRYRTKYHMSMIDNLTTIKNIGKRKFIAQEKIKWQCPICGNLFCVHRPTCQHCGHPLAS